MGILNKNSWLNFFLGLLGFFFVYTIIDLFIIQKNNVSLVSFTAQVPVSYYWLIAYISALILSLVLIFIFCKPGSPLFGSLGLFIGALLGMFNRLVSIIFNLDKYFRGEGLRAFRYLLPHIVVIVGFIISFYTIFLVNKLLYSNSNKA